MSLYRKICLTADENTKVENMLSVTVNASHSSSTTLAIIESTDCPFSLGDRIKIDLGYDDDHGQIFVGYITSVELNIPEKKYTITANDDLVRAINFFIVSSNPNNLLSYSNIAAETLIGNLLALASLTNTDLDSTGFVFGVNNSFTINQVSVYDYCKTITDLLAVTMWCDENGVIHLANVTPYATGEPGEPDPIAYSWEEEKTLSFSFHEDDKNLRNRVVVYGANGLSAEAIDDDSPYFHWKTAVLVATELLDTQTMVTDTANYNLTLFNRLTKTANIAVVGDHTLLPHRYVDVNMSDFTDVSSDINGKYYIYSAEHKIDSGGYTVSLELRK